MKCFYKVLSHCLWLKYCLIWIANGQNLHIVQKYLFVSFYSFERWSKYLRLGNRWQIDTLVQQFYGCFALQVFEPVTWLKAMNMRMWSWRHAALSSGKLLCLSAILRGSYCLSAIEFRAVLWFSVVIVKYVTIVCHSCCIENCKSNSGTHSERKLDIAVCFFAFSL